MVKYSVRVTSLNKLGLDEYLAEDAKAVKAVHPLFQILTKKQYDGLDEIRNKFKELRQDPFHKLILEVRRRHSPKIRELLSDIESIDLEKFNLEVWRSDSGSKLYGQEKPPGLLYLNKRPSPEMVDELLTAYDSGDLELHGNQIWGAGSKIFYPRETDDAKKIKYIKNN